MYAYFMRVSDAADAFPIPMCGMFRFFRLGRLGRPAVHMHLTADFGASGCPGTFHLFYVRGVVQMARAEQVLTLPMAVYVATTCLWGRTVRRSMRSCFNSGRSTYRPCVQGRQG